ncbi:LptA/OstA family protein [Anaeromyxobacter terrae]|uniref:LptA/OstA family protein n=1 Tax=Anaeromyxobacter terrae TaxID=2925406 RepID=UPI001F57D051|nr:LptA/OstA family protein [Anaeromyxobacter sp. SG22]
MTLAALLALAALAGAPQAPAGAKPKRPAASAAPRGAAAAVAGEGKVHIDADELQYVFKQRQVIFTGKPVVLTRGDAKLTCARLVSTNDARGEVAQAVCSGDVRFERGERVVTCEKATYEAAAARLVCEGSPVLKDGPSEARGTRLVYDLKRDEAKLEGAKMVLPGEQVDARRRELEARRKGGTP